MKDENEVRQSTFSALDAEIERARRKFPGANQNFTALIEEVGELAQALLQSNGNPVDGWKQTSAEVYKEAKQVACMAIRMMEEGDPFFPHYTPPQ